MYQIQVESLAYLLTWLFLMFIWLSLLESIIQGSLRGRRTVHISGNCLPTREEMMSIFWDLTPHQGGDHVYFLGSDSP